MGGDGGVVYIPVKKPSTKKCARADELLAPFWQFQSMEGCSPWAKDALYEWENKNTNICAPEWIVGLYGTDRPDYADLNDIEVLCDEDPDMDELTFDELDLDCRTISPKPIGDWTENKWRRLWFSHFSYSSREDVLQKLGALADMTILSWRQELSLCIHVDRRGFDETWT